MNVNLVLPANSEEMLIVQMNGDKAISIFKVHFHQLYPSTQMTNEFHCIIYGGILEGAELTLAFLGADKSTIMRNLSEWGLGTSPIGLTWTR